MGYKALITLDLPDVTDDQRLMFYKILEDEKWSKIDSLTTAWSAEFKDDIDRDSVKQILINDLMKAKKYSSISEINYAFQVGKGQIVTES